MFPKSMPYKGWAILFSAFSLLVSNVGLSKIIEFSAPVLYFLYPLAIVLILLSLFGRFFDYDGHVFRWTIGFTVAAAVFDLLKVSGVAAVQGIVEWVSGWLPLYGVGLGWVVPAVLGLIVGVIRRGKTK